MRAMHLRVALGLGLGWCLLGVNGVDEGGGHVPTLSLNTRGNTWKAAASTHLI